MDPVRGQAQPLLAGRYVAITVLGLQSRDTVGNPQPGLSCSSPTCYLHLLSKEDMCKESDDRGSNQKRGQRNNTGELVISNFMN